MPPRIDLPMDAIRRFCEKWHIVELSLFGSVLREDFTPQSDIDVLVRFDPGFDRTLVDMIDMSDELSELLGRPVDLVQEQGLVNPYRRRGILSAKERIYAA